MAVEARLPLCGCSRSILTNCELSCLSLSRIFLGVEVVLYRSSKVQSMVCSKRRLKSTFINLDGLVLIWLTWTSSLIKWLRFLKVASLIFSFSSLHGLSLVSLFYYSISKRHGKASVFNLAKKVLLITFVIGLLHKVIIMWRLSSLARSFSIEGVRYAAP